MVNFEEKCEVFEYVCVCVCLTNEKRSVQINKSNNKCMLNMCLYVKKKCFLVNETLFILIREVWKYFKPSSGRFLNEFERKLVDDAT